MSLRESLTNVDLFRDLSPSVLDDVVHRGTKFKFGPGRVIVQQGSPTPACNSSSTERPRSRSTMSSGAASTAGQYFGEISLIDAAPRSATVTAGDDGATTFAMSPIAFSDLLDAHPNIAWPLMKVLTARIRSLEAQRG